MVESGETVERKINEGVKRRKEIGREGEWLQNESKEMKMNTINIISKESTFSFHPVLSSL